MSQLLPVVLTADLTLAVVPSRLKSSFASPVTGSENVTRQVRSLAFVVTLEGVSRSMDTTVGASSSKTAEYCVAAVF